MSYRRQRGAWLGLAGLSPDDLKRLEEAQKMQQGWGIGTPIQPGQGLTAAEAQAQANTFNTGSPTGIPGTSSAAQIAGGLASILGSLFAPKPGANAAALAQQQAYLAQQQSSQMMKLAIVGGAAVLAAVILLKD